ncbi:MAG: carboxypeptidase-like regulatory domain-containing protein [Pseudomonadota bacterium]|nr:carboxypeptidase-like regulatory domain-containing protein [Pseudomonadota bacterium]
MIQIFVALATVFSTLSLAEVNPSLPTVKSQGQTQFISGGIGKDESEAILHARSSWSLMLELTQATGPRAEYISDVQITIKDELGNTVLDTTAEGPYLLVNLSPGKYSLEATYKSATLHRNLSVQKKPGKKITLVWPVAKDN